MERTIKNTEKKDFQQVLHIENSPFTILKDLEKDDFIIVMGNAIATHKRYKKVEQAIRDVKHINWDLVATFFLKMRNYMEKPKTGPNEEIQEEKTNTENNN